MWCNDTKRASTSSLLEIVKSTVRWLSTACFNTLQYFSPWVTCTSYYVAINTQTYNKKYKHKGIPSINGMTEPLSKLKVKKHKLLKWWLKKTTSQLCEIRNLAILDNFSRCSVRGWDVTCFLPLGMVPQWNCEWKWKKASLNINIINSIFRFILSLPPVILKVQRLKGNFILPLWIFWCKAWLWADFAPDEVAGLWQQARGTLSIPPAQVEVAQRCCSGPKPPWGSPSALQIPT